MGLPLLERAREDSVTCVVTPKTAARAPLPPLAPVDRARMPDRAPGPGEQYRFHVDMGTCIGCKCCVVACNEQNGNPAAINWRRVGEIEGGWYPNTRRAYLSMGCNHCLEPTCLRGCPVDAYTKDAATGIVLHSADTCIGCQYCTWNCSYGVPQFNAERGVVGKCDMCYGRLIRDEMPACVSACPEGAIAIEIVGVAGWKSDCETAPAISGLPSDDCSVSTTRVTLPDRLPPAAKAVDLTHVRPEAPHWPLVFMTVLTQLSVGAFATIWLLQLAGATTRLGLAAAASLLVGAVALNASTLHLGRPIYAYRALRMWKRSWLSREVLLFTSFSIVAGMYAASLWFEPSAVLGGLTTALGCGGVLASACIYRVGSRPAWNTPLTLLQFGVTAALLGLLFTAAIGVGDRTWLNPLAATVAIAALLLLALRFFRLIASDTIELRGTARLLSTTLRTPFIARGALLAAGGLVLPLLAVGSLRASAGPLGSGSDGTMWAAFALAVAGEVVGRYLFFVSVVPRHMAAPYLAVESEAA
jgi:Fe-S-cluster-containing dehydrogenase component/DMSO reductase anchor subunit